MKIWKKISLLLCACIAFSTVATSCDSLFGNSSEASASSSSSSSSSNSSSSSSSSIEDSSSSGMEDSSSGEEEDDNNAMLDIYLGQAIKTLTESKSAQITFEVNNNGVLESGVLDSVTTWKMMSGIAKFSKTEEGFDMEIDANITSLEDPSLTPEQKKYYVIDGYVYEYFAKTNTYNKYVEDLETILSNTVHSATQGQYTLTTLLAALVGMFENTDGSDMTFEGLEGNFGDILAVEGGVTETGAWIAADGTAKADELLAFLDTVGKESTFGQLLDFLLKQIVPDLTTEKIIADLYPRGKNTVKDLVEEFDEKSIAETEKSLQENLDSILKNETVKEAIDSVLGEEYGELASEILNFNIKEFLDRDSQVLKDETPVKYGELTLNDLSKELVKTLIESMGENNEILGELGLLSENVNWGMIVSAMEMILDMKPFENIAEDSVFYKLLTQAQALKVSKADVRAEIIPVKEGIEKVSAVATFQGEREKDGITSQVNATANVELSKFSKEALSIALPENATLAETVYNTCAGCGEQKEDASYREDEYGYYCDTCYAALPQEPTEPNVPETTV